MSMLDSTPASPLILSPEFPPEIRHFLKKIQRQSDETIATLTTLYLSQQPEIEGMPRIGALTEADAVAVELLPSYSTTQDKNWAGLRARADRCKQHEDDAGNPMLPRWISKTDDRQSPWLNDMGMISDTAKSALTTICRMASPHKNARWQDLLGLAPTDNMDFLEDICHAICNQNPFFIRDLGEGPDPDWRWCMTMAMLGGLGTAAVRRILLSKSGIEEDLDFWVNCTEEELTRDILKCQQISGVPIALLRCEWPRIQRALAEEDFTGPDGKPHVPQTMIACMLVHVFKHCRFILNSDPDENRVVVAHKGSFGRYDIPKVDQPFLSGTNKALARDICYALGFPFPNGKNDNWVAKAVTAIFSVLKPSDLPLTRPSSEKCVYIPAPSTYMMQMKERASASKWVDTGVAVRNVAYIDLETGDVDKDYFVTGADTIMYDWPKRMTDASVVRNWRAQLPTKIVPELGADVIMRRILNVNTLGETEGYKALINAVLTADLGRQALAGSLLGGLLTQEYPLLYVLPMGHTMETTTNQGKTNFGRIIGSALVQSVTVTKMNMSSSAPAQRTIAVPLELYGMAIFDEFQIPSDSAHFLDAGGIQALATGVSVSPGKAGENHPGLWLRHPLVLVSKVAVAPEDIINRSIPTFMDVLTAATRAQGKELTELMTPTAGMLVRLAHLMYMKKTNLIDKLMQLDQESSPTFRFDGHYTIARQFGSVESIDAYILKARDQMRAQHTEAERSGLVDQVGMSHRFDPKWFFNACAEDTLQMLCLRSSADKLGALSAASALREIIENGNERRLDAVLNSFRIKEFTANRSFIDLLLKDGSWTRPGWKITYVPKDKSTIKKGNEPISYIVVDRHIEKDTDGDKASGPG